MTADDSLLNPLSITPPDNRPGLSQIVYRISDYREFRRRLIERLPTALRPQDPLTGEAPLAKLTTRAEEDPAIALLDAWAVVADVLTFYQERIANEGYLRTATERRSVLELARAIGYELSPGVAASTFLTFTVEDAPGSPDVVTVPQGTAIMSVPAKDELPQTFETSQEFVARRDWNALTPRASRPQSITSATRHLYLNGTSVQLQPNDFVLLLDDVPDRTLHFLTITRVEPNTVTNRTLIAWEPLLNPIQTPLRRPKLFAFRQSAGLFGNQAPLWTAMPAEIKLAALAAKGEPIQGGVFLSQNNGQTWVPVSQGLPNETITCLATKSLPNQKSLLLAGTPSKGIFRSLDHGQTWEAVNSGLINLKIQAIYVDESGAILAATPNGGVFRSRDNGENWVDIHTGEVRVEKAKDSDNWLSINRSIPAATVVRSLLIFTHPPEPTDSPSPSPASTHYLLAGTDQGLYYSTDQGRNWDPLGLGDRAIYSLCYQGSHLLAGTDQGIFYSSNQGSAWEPRVASSPVVTIFALTSFASATTASATTTSATTASTATASATTASAANKVYFFAGTANGVFRAEDAGTTWTAINQVQRTIQPTNQADGEISLADCSVYAFAIDRRNTSPRLYAATDRGIFISSNSTAATADEVRWQRVLPNPIVQSITALTLSPANNTANSPAALFAGTRFLGFTAAEVQSGTNNTRATTAPSPSIEWPGFQIQDPTQLDLDTLYPQILPASWIALVNKTVPDPTDPAQKPSLHIAIGQIKTTTVSLRSDFGLSSKITRLELESPIESDSSPLQRENFGLRSTAVFVRSEELALALEPLTVGDRQHTIFDDPLPSSTVFLSRFVQALQPNQTLIVSGQRIRVHLEDVGGLFRSSPLRQRAPGEKPLPWTPSNQGLSNSQVRSLAINPQGTLLLAGTTAGVFQSDNQGQHWEPLFTWDAFSKTLNNPAIQALRLTDDTHILVGTAEGVFRSQDGGTRWESINEGLENLDIRAIALQREILLLEMMQEGQTYLEEIPVVETTLLLGTLEGGLFQSQDGGDRWVPTGLNMTDVQALAVQPPIRLRSLPQGDPSTPPDEHFLRSKPSWYAGTLRHGFFRSASAGVFWEQITTTRPGIGSISSRGTQVTGSGTQFSTQLQVGDIIHVAEQTRTVVDIQAASDASSETLTLNAPLRPDLSSNTPFTIQTGLTNLNITALALGSRLGQGTLSSLSPSDAGSTPSAPSIFLMGQNTRFTTTLTVGDQLTVNGETRMVKQILSDDHLEVDQAILLPANSPFLINESLIFAGTAGSGVFRSWDRGDRWEPVITNLKDLEIRCLTLADTGELWVGTAQEGAFYSTDKGDTWVSVGQELINLDVRSILLPSSQTPLSEALIGGIGILRSPDTLYSTPIQRHDVLEILEPPIITTDSPESPPELNGYWSLKLLDHQGFIGFLTVLPTAFRLLPADPKGEIVSEVTVIQDPPTDQQLPVLTLQKPLRYSYDPATVQIYANVVEATHGETVEEVLGSGDGNAIHQQFALSKLPLTYVPAPTTRGTASTLQIRVNGVLWQEAPNLYGLTAQDQQYILRLEDDGTTIVTFGDGNKGARLLTGEENITATYRSGIGLEGNVGAGSLSILKTRPLGISDVINPLPASGAASPEPMELARVKAPPTVRTLDRIVSLQDFEDFARGFAGIGKAEAIALWNGDTQLVHLTIAGIDGAPVPEESNLYRQLLEAINRARDPIQAIEVDSYELILFNLEAQLLIDPRYEADIVQAQVRAQLQTTFSFEHRAFEQPVTASEAIAAMQQVAGMIAVDLDALYQTGTSKALEQSLIALPARYDPQSRTNHPAQLLLLNPNGIQLTLPPVNSPTRL